MAGGRSSQILKVRQYNPFIYHNKEKQKASALAKFHAFIADSFWKMIPQISTYLGILCTFYKMTFLQASNIPMIIHVPTTSVIQC